MGTLSRVTATGWVEETGTISRVSATGWVQETLDTGVTGDSSQAIGAVTGTATGTVPITGTSSKTLADVTGTAAGSVAVIGQSSQTLGSVTGTASGTVSAAATTTTHGGHHKPFVFVHEPQPVKNDATAWPETGTLILRMLQPAASGATKTSSETAVVRLRMLQPTAAGSAQARPEQAKSRLCEFVAEKEEDALVEGRDPALIEYN
jgi:hypothetical protein